MGGPLGECARTPRTPGGPLVLTGHAGFMFQEENRLFHTHVGALDRKMENTRVFTLMHKPLNEGARARISSQSCRIVPQTQVGSPVVRLPLPRHSLPAAGLLPGPHQEQPLLLPRAGGHVPPSAPSSAGPRAPPFTVRRQPQSSGS